MKISKFLILISLITTLTLGTLNITRAEESMPVSIDEATDQVVKRKGPDYLNYGVMFTEICIKGRGGDKTIMKQIYLNYVNKIMKLNDNWKTEIEKTRSLTEKELSDYNKVKEIYAEEVENPGRPSVNFCDAFVSSYSSSLGKEVDLFRYKEQKKALADEYNTGAFITINPNLKTYHSNILDTDVAVIQVKTASKVLGDAFKYKAVVLENTNSEGLVKSYYMFIRNKTISDLDFSFKYNDTTIINSEFLVKIYKKLYLYDKTLAPSIVAPLIKVGKSYYMYNKFTK